MSASYIIHGHPGNHCANWEAEGSWLLTWCEVGQELQGGVQLFIWCALPMGTLKPQDKEMRLLW